MSATDRGAVSLLAEPPLAQQATATIQGTACRSVHSTYLLTVYHKHPADQHPRVSLQGSWYSH
jgi:hypothetical protein